MVYRSALYRSLALAAFVCAVPATASAQSGTGGAIETQPLTQLDAWTVSALSPQQGALPADLWNRSDPAFLASVFDRLPATYESPAAQALARRVLFSGGDAPRGDAQAAARKRFEALGKMGAADELAVMAAGAGTSLNDPIVAQYAAQAELARGRRLDACARGRSANVGDHPPPFILRLRAYCAAAAGDRAEADLALELARGGTGANAADDAWYSGAISAVGGAPGARPLTARYDNSLAAQISLSANLRPGPNPLANASTLALVALARSDSAPQPQRAQAAALAYRRGALSAQETRTILLATPAEITSALPPIAVALRQVQGAPGSLAAATAISTVLRQSTAPADFAAAARFFKEDIAALQSAPDQAAALAFARAAIITGDADSATRLVASARAAGVDQSTLAPLDAALSVIAGVRGDSGTVAMHRRIDAAGASQARAAARDVAILAALGAPVDGQVESFLLTNAPQGGVRGDTGAMLTLAAAVERGAVGEGALLAVIASGDGPARLDADSLERIIRALRGLRLEGEARRFAVEALLAGAPAS